MSVDGRDNTPRILQAKILANYGDGTLLVDLGDGEEAAQAYVASSAVVGEWGTFLDVQGGLVQLAPPTPSSGSGGSPAHVSFVPNGSFETWGPLDATGYQEPTGWSGFWGPTTRNLHATSDPAGVTDGLLAAQVDTALLTATGEQNVMMQTPVRSPADDSGFVVSVDVTLSDAATLWGFLVYWGRTAAEAVPFGGGITTVLRTVSAGPLGRTAFVTETYAPPGGYRYVTFSLIARQGVGTASFDDVQAVWLTADESEVPLPAAAQTTYTTAVAIGTAWTQVTGCQLVVNNPHPSRIMRALVMCAAQGTIATGNFVEVGNRGSGASTISEGQRADRGYAGPTGSSVQIRGHAIRLFNPGNTTLTLGCIVSTGSGGQNMNYFYLGVVPTGYASSMSLERNADSDLGTYDTEGQFDGAVLL